MDESKVGKLNHGAEIKRKTKKIHYRKSKVSYFNEFK